VEILMATLDNAYVISIVLSKPEHQLLLKALNAGYYRLTSGDDEMAYRLTNLIRKVSP